MATVQGKYKGKDIYAGTDAYVTQQMQAIDAASAPKTAPISQAPMTPAPQPTTPTAPQAYTPPQPAAPQQSTQTSQTTQPTQQTAAQTQTTAPVAQTQQLTYDPAKNPSIVDLLNSVGQDSSFAARKQLAQQFGVQQYTGSANQNIELAKKFTDFYNSKKGSAVPESNAAFRQEMQAFNEQNQGKMSPEEAEKSFFESYLSMNPAMKTMYDTINQAMSSTNQRTSLVEEYQKLQKESGLEELKMEAMDIKRIMEGNEDDIRNEIQAAQGFATEGQIRALTDARNKSLLRQASDLNAQIQMKEDYIDKIVQLTGMDRDALDKEMDRKLGLTKTMFDMQTRIEDAARDNYRNIVKDIGYDGLVNSLKSPQDLQRVASSLGMTPGSLLQLSKTKTSAQRQLQLDEMNYALSVDKFNEDTRRFGLSYALDVQKVNAANVANQLSAASLYSSERADRAINNAENLMMYITTKNDKGEFAFDKSKASKVLGTNAALWGWKPDTPQYDFKSQVESLKSQIAQKELTEMREASKTGGALGNASDKDMELLMASMGNLSTWQSPEQFYKTLNQVIDTTAGWQAKKSLVQMGYDLTVYDRMIKDGWKPQEIYQYIQSL